MVEDHFLLSITLVIKSGTESEVQDLNRLIGMFTLYLGTTLLFYLVDGLQKIEGVEYIFHDRLSTSNITKVFLKLIVLWLTGWITIISEMKQVYMLL
jgi:hypothetical protein